LRVGDAVAIALPAFSKRILPFRTGRDGFTRAPFIGRWSNFGRILHRTDRLGSIGNFLPDSRPRCLPTQSSIPR
ncbi:hypothetical protein, partial [Burkholderia multivorans]|uniref:hypothetical protein n=1 Tax=Burkholderia multivorans TaxID=87883 RepID=UPI0021C0DF30